MNWQQSENKTKNKIIPEYNSPEKCSLAGGTANKKNMPLYILLPVIVISLAVSLPLIYLLFRVSAVDLSIISLLRREQTIRALFNTVSLAAAVTISSILVALPLGWLTVRSNLPGKKYWGILAMVPLVIPSLIGGFTFVSAFGQGGLISSFLQQLNLNFIPDIYGFFGTWILLTLLCYPYIFLPVRSTLLGMKQSQIEAARTLGLDSWQIFYKITLPKLKPAITGGSMLVILYTISDFAAVSLLQFNTFTRMIYIQYQTSFNRTYAAFLALILVLMAFVIVALEMKNRGQTNYHSIGSGAERQLSPLPLGKWKGPALLFCVTIIGLALILPITVSTFWLIRGLIQGEQIIIRPVAALNSFSAATITSVLAIFAALPIAIMSTEYKSKLSSLLEKFSYIGYALPGIVVALALVFFGANYAGVFYQTLPLLIFAYIILFLPQALGSLRSSLLQINPHLEEAGLTLGFSSFKVLTKITVPLIKPGILSGAALVFLTIMKELPATLILSPIGYRTLTTEIWNATIEAFYARAAAPSLLLIMISTLSMAVLFYQENHSSFSQEEKNDN